MTMRYYPVFLDLHEKKCLVVGGGNVGTRKVGTLLECGARVVLTAPEVTPKLADLADQGKISWNQRAYRPEDLDGMTLVIGATNDETLNRRIHAEATHLNTLCNIADRPEICNFILPSIVNQGDLTIAISTSGKSPAFAKQLRREIAGTFGPEYGIFLDLMGKIRKRLLAEEHAPEAHKPIFEQLIGSGLLKAIRKKETDAADIILREILGPEYGWETLMGPKTQERTMGKET